VCICANQPYYYPIVMRKFVMTSVCKIVGLVVGIGLIGLIVGSSRFVFDIYVSFFVFRILFRFSKVEYFKEFSLWSLSPEILPTLHTLHWLQLFFFLCKCISKFRDSTVWIMYEDVLILFWFASLFEYFDSLQLVVLTTCFWFIEHGLCAVHWLPMTDWSKQNVQFAFHYWSSLVYPV